MDKLPRGVSPQRVIRFLGKHGFRVEQGGNHAILRKGELKVPVPRHGPISTGTLHRILKGARVPREQWRDL